MQDGTVKHYTGYEVSELTGLACQLNDMIARPQKSGLNTVATKYSHPYVSYSLALGFSSLCVSYDTTVTWKKFKLIFLVFNKDYQPE
jgi:hypothetical protein